jgi:hypothetical protein
MLFAWKYPTPETFQYFTVGSEKNMEWSAPPLPLLLQCYVCSDNSYYRFLSVIILQNGNLHPLKAVNRNSSKQLMTLFSSSKMM